MHSSSSSIEWSMFIIYFMIVILIDPNNIDINWICVCSDESVSDFGTDDLAVLTQDTNLLVRQS